MYVGGRVKAGAKISRAGNSQPIELDGINVLLRDVISVHLDSIQTREMGAEDAANRAAPNDANLHRRAYLGLSVPE
jgi:hypothetical protein